MGAWGFCTRSTRWGPSPSSSPAPTSKKKEYLPKIASGEKLIAFCLSEKFAGSDAQSLRVHAEQDGEHYIIDGEKKWTTNGGAADLYTVFAVTDPTSKSRRISAFVVEKHTDGFSIGKHEDKMGIRCVPVVETVFDRVRVPADNVLGGKPGLGFKHAMGTLDKARPAVASPGRRARPGCARPRHRLCLSTTPVRRADQ